MTAIFEKLRQGLSKTRDGFLGKWAQLVQSSNAFDEDFFDGLEEILVSADIGIKTSMDILGSLRQKAQTSKNLDPADIKALLRDIILEMIHQEGAEKNGQQPRVILVVGVNGVGKTTSIAKMAYLFLQSGHRVMLAAADTFRAAASEQLSIWGERIGVPVIRHQEGADPAAVVFDAISSAKAKNVDVLICDTAGRLHNKKNLMDELSKISRVIEREYPEAIFETYLVLDATTGQNALVQAKAFLEISHVSGIILTKLDGTAKGGIVIPIMHELGIPVRYIGVGEQLEDLQKFVPEDFVQALL